VKVWERVTGRGVVIDKVECPSNEIHLEVLHISMLRLGSYTQHPVLFNPGW
jgi:hypothetical protein